ncbi:hypothetical protein A1O1_08107 [Capronia coronata CBS 617.96]|uniref:Uncharacterized protein n=1 Tax=Capronia coronata CBS 617.96 TaxID=1182541 RepID=W9YIB7_9EURO|nr:uncharacterized protein A1O1_08107 [Capronia coronata CBS 617.96]EXJ82039.1 hypothetical protein A1O1_08107 [Capronia coronata CBS 617.96]
MAPIPVHTGSPINTNIPSYPGGASPSTAAARYTPGDPQPTPTTATTTSAQNASPSSLPARPGAPAVPQPTNTASSTYNHRLEPTTTAALPTQSTHVNDSPPLPQPGALPVPSLSSNQSPKLSIPPPPQPGQMPHWSPSSASPIRHAVPSQTPTHSRPGPLSAHQHSPALYTPARSIPPAGVTSNYPQDLSHPPGYMQDSRASFDDKPIEFCQPLEKRASPTSSNRGGILDAEPTLETGFDEEPSVLGSALAWAKAAGKRLSKTEAQIWKQINGDSNN